MQLLPRGSAREHAVLEGAKGAGFLGRCFRWATSIRNAPLRLSVIVFVFTLALTALLLVLLPRQRWLPELGQDDELYDIGEELDGLLPVTQEEKLIGGLLADGFDDESCRSRYRYRTPPRSSPAHRPSEHLLQRLREHEDLQRKCGPGTEAYRNATRQLSSKDRRQLIGDNLAAECKYLVNVPYTGLGNNMLSAASAFLYAVLTDRVLLVDFSAGGTGDLFCEPFLNASWLVPEDFPISRRTLDRDTPLSFGRLLQSGALSARTTAPAYVYLNLDSDNSFHDRLFYCDENHRMLGNFTWLVMWTNLYIVPQFFLMPTFQDELVKLFPEKEATFHLLSRYLFHPGNKVWSRIVRYYNSHLAEADERVGIQIRTQWFYHPPVNRVLDQVLSCARTAGVLPQAHQSSMRVSKAVLITSLSPSYTKKIKDLYEDNDEANNSEIIRVHQPSHEGKQKFRDKHHSMKALEEIYLLSLCDKLITSPASTFGYVAQGLGGLKPWLMTPTQEPDYAFDAPCRPAQSVEPCLHKPTWYDCARQKDVDNGNVVPYIRHCEDVDFGIKIIE